MGRRSLIDIENEAEIMRKTIECDYYISDF